MRKIAAIIVVMLACMCVYTSPSIYISPERGSVDVDMGSTKYPERIEHQSITKVSALSENSSLYSSYTCAAVIGAKDIDDGNDEGISFRVVPDGSTFRYSSQTLPSASRPYRLYSVVNYSTATSPFNDPVDLFEVQPGIEYTVTEPSVVSMIPSSKGTVTGIWIDLVIAMPGASSINGNILYLSGTRYYLSPANDYMSAVTIESSLYDTADEKVISKASENILLMGWYNTSGTPRTRNCALSITPAGSGYLLDLSRFGSLSTIAELSLRIAYSERTTDPAVVNGNLLDPGHHPEKVEVFLSSSPDPFVQGERFRFTKNGALRSITDSNSIHFKIEAVGNDGSNNTCVTFDGTDWHDAASGGVVGAVLPVMYKTQYMYHTGEWSIWTEYSGELAVRLEEKESGMLEAGRYSADVYVHVVTEDNPDYDELTWI